MRESVRPVMIFEVIEPAPTADTSLEEAKQTVGRIVQKAAKSYLDQLEREGKIEGSFHAMQKLAETASSELEARWSE